MTEAEKAYQYFVIAVPENEEQAKAYFWARKALQPTLAPPNEWVSVEDAVPDPGERVLATDGTFVGEAYRTSANIWYRHTGFPWRDCLQSIVTHWMPLPEPPDRLAAYEDTGLEPEEIKRTFNETAVLKLAGQALGITPDRLCELAKADREGRCVVLPAKIHDKLYYLSQDRNEEIKEIEVESIHSWGGKWQLFTHTDESSKYYERYDIDFKKVGKNVFLTRKEAEAALEARQDAKDAP